MSLRGALIATMTASLALGGCSLAGRSLGRYIDDKSITGGVKLKITQRNTAALARVNVDTFEGTVYLSGAVDTPTEKSDAEIAAWQIDGVEQVINDLRVRRAEDPPPTVASRSTLLDSLPGIARVDPGLPGQPGYAYDRSGRMVATVYTVSMRELGQSGLEDAHAVGRPIDHVSIYPVAPHADVPDAQYHVVLWHVSQSEAAAFASGVATPRPPR